MTAKDLKLKTWYIEDNSWNKLWFYGIKQNKWLIYDPYESGSISVTNEIIDDGFDTNPPKEENIDRGFKRSVLRLLFGQGYV